MTNEQITFTAYTDEADRKGGYVSTHVIIRMGSEEDNAHHRDQAVDNKAGYGSDGAALRALRLYQAALDAGHSVSYGFGYACSDVVIHLRWLHVKFDDGTWGYCDPSYENLGRSYDAICSSMALLKRLGRIIERISLKRRRAEWSHASLHHVASNTFRDPGLMVQALVKMKAISVRYDRSLELVVPCEAFVPPEGAPAVQSPAGLRAV